MMFDFGCKGTTIPPNRLFYLVPLGYAALLRKELFCLFGSKYKSEDLQFNHLRLHFRN